MSELSPLAVIMLFILIYMVLWGLWFLAGIAYGMGAWCSRIISRWLDRRERRQWK